MDQLEQTLSATPEKASADNGYWSEANAAYCDQHGIDAYIATGRDKHGAKPVAPEAGVSEVVGAKARMRSKLQTEVGRSTYSRRKAIVEPVLPDPELRKKLEQLERKARLLVAMLVLFRALVAVSRFRLERSRLADPRFEIALLGAVERAENAIPQRAALRVLGLTTGRA